MRPCAYSVLALAVSGHASMAKELNDASENGFVPGREHARHYQMQHPNGQELIYDETPAEWPGVPNQVTRRRRAKETFGRKLKGSNKGGEEGDDPKMSKGLKKGDSGDDDLVGIDLSRAYRKKIKRSGLRKHCEEWQEIADIHGGIRAAGSSGYVASVKYVIAKLEEVGYDLHYTDVMADYYEEISAPQLEVASSMMTIDYTMPANDPMTFYGFPGSSSGTVEAAVTPVDFGYGDGSSGSSGCESDDFGSFPSGNIALVRRGACSYYTKIANAMDAGASAVILTNDGSDGNMEAIGNRFRRNVGIPVIFASSYLGMSILDATEQGEVVLNLATNVIAEERVNKNILAETDYGDSAQTIMIGAHLDSVFEGPGIQDNTSGSSAALELALQLKKNGWDNPDVMQHKIRFAWWAAEEIGLLGSTQYVEGLSDEQIDEIAMYLNMDMIGSPNFVRFVLDGDGSNSQYEPIPEPDGGMAHIEATYLQYFDEVGLPVEQEPFSNSYHYTDHTPFYDAGIPVSDLHTGIDIAKSEEQEEIFGGTAGEPWDPCYHQPCDTIDNVNFKVAEEMARAAAHALAMYGSREGDVFD